jgi:predicted lipoprotein with Yx(FWY)xxD motif
MQKAIAVRASRTATGVALLALALAAVALGAGGAAAKGTKRVVDTGQSPSLEKTVLTDTAHHTLYSLSVEKRGRFVCTGTCLKDWHPLTIKAGVKPTGPVMLGTVKRPEGSLQVTYKGLPLYSFDGDRRAGEANGEGIKDVGTWHAATPGKASAAPQAAPSPY